MDNKGFESDTGAPPSEIKDKVQDGVVRNGTYEAVELTEFSDSPIPESNENKATDNKGFEIEAGPLPSEKIDIDSVYVDILNDETNKTVEMTEFSNSPIPEINADKQTHLTNSEHASTDSNFSESEENVSEIDESTEGDSGTRISETDSVIVDADDQISSNEQETGQEVPIGETKHQDHMCKLKHHITNDAVYNERKKDTKRRNSQTAVITTKSSEGHSNGTVSNKGEFVKVFLERKDDCIILRPMDLIRPGIR